MKVYVETVLLSGLTKRDIKQKELRALERILDAWKSKEIEDLDLYTSPVAREELARIPPKYRATHERVYEMPEEVPLSIERAADPRMEGTGVIGSLLQGILIN